MHISVIGQDTLAAATAECCARFFTVVRTPDSAADVVWFAYDTPITDDIPDSEWVMERIREQMVDLGTRPLIIVSSQMPVGTTAQLEKEFPQHRFAHSPENIRVATAVKDFERQARIVIGIRNPTADENQLIAALFAPFTQMVILTDPETAELSKMALNVWLSLQIVFINEIARLVRCEGGDPDKVSLALRSDARCNMKAPLRPGAPYGGGHLAREVYNAYNLAAKHGVVCPIIANIKRSNEIS